MYPIKEIRLLFVSSWFPSCHSIINLTVVIAISVSLLQSGATFLIVLLRVSLPWQRKKFCYQISFAFTRYVLLYHFVALVGSTILSISFTKISSVLEATILFFFLYLHFFGRSMVHKNVTSALHGTKDFDPIGPWDKR